MTYAARATPDGSGTGGRSVRVGDGSRANARPVRPVGWSVRALAPTPVRIGVGGADGVERLPLRLGDPGEAGIVLRVASLQLTGVGGGQPFLCLLRLRLGLGQLARERLTFGGGLLEQAGQPGVLGPQPLELGLRGGPFVAGRGRLDAVRGEGRSLTVVALPARARF